MITYLLNFVLCSGLLLLGYRVFLDNERLYKFNRFYLLFSLVFSLAVPLITIKVLPKPIPLFTSQVISPPVSPVVNTPVYQQTVAVPASPVVKGPVYQQTIAQSVTPIVNALVHQPSLQTPAPNYNYLPMLIGIYLIIAIGMLLRFTKNLYYINRSVSKNAIRAADGTKLILVDEEVTPHSFLNYVFINKKDYRDGSIEPEIICHEQAHVQQLHSLDVIFVELLQVICWFNPVIPFYRRAIQLNHEFLADEAVIKSYDDTPAYQHLLLSKASQCGSLYLTSQFNYLTTKKRLIMMTKTTSAKIALYKQLAILPVLAAVVLLFSNKVIAQNKQISQKPVGTETKSNRIMMAERPMYLDLAEADCKTIPPAKYDASQHILDEYAAILKKYDISTLMKSGISNSAGSIFFNKITRNQVFSKTDRLRLQDMFDQMSKKQQDAQIIQFGPLLLPVPKKSPNAEQLTEWRTKKRYRLYIDGKIVDRAELADYKPSDFDCYETGVLANDDPDYGKYKFEIDLMTPGFYATDYKQTIDEKFRLPYAKGFSKLPDLSKMRKVAKADNKIQIDKQTTNPPDFVFITKPIPPAKHDAPLGVLDEYAAILRKYNLPPDTSKMHGQLGINFSTSNADRLKLQDLFNQMSKAQQSKQQIQYGVLELPSPKRSPTDQQLASWQDTKKFRVWIDNKKIDQKELAKYKAEDFDGWSVGHLSEKTNPNYKAYQHEVRLMTKAGYDNYYKQMVNDKRQMPMWTILMEKYSKRKAE